MISIAGTYKKGEWAPAFLSGVQVFAVHGAEVALKRFEPIWKYSPEVKADLADEECIICGRLFCRHSQEQFEQCMDEIVKRAQRSL